MAAIKMCSKWVLGLGLATGLAQVASAQTYVGTYSGADNGSITINIDANGAVSFNFESRSIRVGSTANDIVGKGLIVHRDPDDYTTQPTGNAGPRLACAVITAK